MIRRFGGILILFALGLCCATAPAQSLTPASEQVRLGDSVVALNGPWKFHVGDSPLDPATGKPLWAEPGFDDSGWETVDLTPTSGSLDPISGLTDFVPGWTGKGHPGFWGYAWYRIRVHVDSRPGVNLALAGPSNVDDAYQVFFQGSLLGSFGDFSKPRPVIYYTQPMMFPLPDDSGKNEGTGQASGSDKGETIAFRFWMEANTLQQGTDVGGMHVAPLLGQAGAVTARHQMRWVELIRSYILSPFQALIFTLLGLVACSLMLFDRSDRVYLWIGMILITSGVSYGVTTIGSWTQWFGALSLTIFSDVILIPLTYAGWVMVWRIWFRLRRPTWMPSVLAILVALLMISNALGDNIFFNIVSQPVSQTFHVSAIVIRVVLALLMLVNVFFGITEQGLEGWLVLPATLFAAIGGLRLELNMLHIRIAWFIFGTTVTMAQMASLLLIATVAVLLLRRLTVSIKTQRQMALDVRQAQEVQQVILPEGNLALPGFSIESEYRPAREVGGDFFQIIPHPTDGSLLIVAGDVTGKGLKAGMLVALLVGAIRSTAEVNSDPKSILRALNRRLMGRGDAQATCLALRIDTYGNATLANAGHLSPYLNQFPVAMEGTLPLGMIENAEISVMRFLMKEKDRLVLLSDGVAEATNAEGRLFGFERVQELLRTAHSASEVADAAEMFGQADDISVISVTRTAVREPAMA